MLTITYINFWKNVGSVQDRWLTNFIKNNIDTNVQEISHYNITSCNNHPDILISSCFGPITNVTKINAKVKIFFYGENLDRYPPYNNINLLKNTFDLIIGFKYTDKINKIYRLPLWITYYPYYNVNNSMNLITYLQSEYAKNILNTEKKGCSLISRHDRGGQRTVFYNEMCKYCMVFCPSNFKKNMKSIGNGNNNKKRFLQKTVYNICPENSSYEGYCTEKIFQALEAGCIPLYWGVDLPEKELLNPNCYLFVKDINDSELVKCKVRDIVNNKNNYVVDNIFNENAKDILKKYYDDVKIGIIEKLRGN